MFQNSLLMLGLILGAGTAPQAEPARSEKKPDDLASKLIRKTIEESASEDPMGQLAQEMSEIVRRLQVDFDPGDQTQAQQRQVSAKLDEAIKAAAARRRMQSKPDPKQHSDKRINPVAKKAPGKTGPDAKQALPSKANDSSEKASDATSNKEQQKQDSPGQRRAWGNLPQRDREEVLQGAEEESLERFRQWIDQYFKALQETNR